MDFDYFADKGTRVNAGHAQAAHRLARALVGERSAEDYLITAIREHDEQQLNTYQNIEDDDPFVMNAAQQLVQARAAREQAEEAYAEHLRVAKLDTAG